MGVSVYGRIGRFVGNLWGIVRHLLAVRGLLQWSGWWETVTAVIMSQVLSVWSAVKGVPWPVAVLIGIVAFVFTSAAWRINKPISPASPDVVPARPVRAETVRTPFEGSTFAALSSQFMRLSWAQKVALKLLVDGRASDELTLFTRLEELGLGKTQEMMDRIIKGLHECDLVQFTRTGGKAGMLIPNPARIRDVEEIVNGWTFEF